MSSGQLESLHDKIRNYRVPRAEKAPYLLVMLHADKPIPQTNTGAGERMYKVYVWLLDDQNRVVDAGITIEDIPRELGDIPGLLGYALEQSLSVESLVDTIDDLVIEFLLPEELLNHDFYHLPVTVGGVEFMLGVQYRVVVRPVKRVTMPLFWPAWRKKWAQLQDVLKHERNLEDFVCVCTCEEYRVSSESKCAVLVCSREECQTQNRLPAVLRGPSIICLVLAHKPEGVPVEGNHVFRTLLLVGMPVALWPRMNINSAEALMPLLSCNSLNTLPERVWEWRRDSVDEQDIGNHLTLLWDDPFRLPPTMTAPKLGAPTRKG